MTAISQPRSAYVHLPFCRHRCGYCNFTVIAGRDDLVASYLEALEREFSQLGFPHPLDTLYIGGGTPTHLSSQSWKHLLKDVLHWYVLQADYEWTIEANPIDIQPELVDLLADHGVTRISLGAQSFHNGKLKFLERDHDAKTIRYAVDLCRSRFQSISLDLMFAVGKETLADWQKDLQLAVELEPDHLSTYGLTYEKGTTFWNRKNRGDLVSLDEQLERDMYESALDQLTTAGFQHYEVSSFARPNHRCRHNIVYWQGGEYLAAGAGAARFIAGCREINHRSTTTYLKRVLAGQSPVAEREQLSNEQMARDRLIFGLRMLEGINCKEFVKQTGFTLEELAGRAIERFISKGLLTRDPTQLRVTREGLMMSDSMWPDLL